MKRCLAFVLGAFLVSMIGRADDKPVRPDQDAFFEKSVRPVLASHCFSCHGPEKQKAGLRLDSRPTMMSGGDSGPAVVAGKPEESLLIKAIRYESEPQMPPKAKLGNNEIAALTRWVAEGALWPASSAPVRTEVAKSTFSISEVDRRFWSFQKIKKLTPPRLADAGWARTGVDRFILAEWEKHGLQTAGQADKRTLLRRVTFDLTGLPPTPEEIEAFVHDERPDAYARVVERLLGSPRHGERWSRHWLDVARYGEDQAHTFQSRKYPNGFRYRDWLINAFNRDMPYDQFVLNQIAADLIEGPDKLERLPALGFFALGPVYYGDAKKLDQYDDRIDTLTRGFLGLTVACARCHDHKFDPISSQDYYALAGVFASTEYEEFPLVSREIVEEALKKQTDQEKKNKVPPKYPFVHAMKDAPKPVVMKVHVRGNPSTLGEDSPHRFLSILGAEPFKQGSGRLELAQAIASKNNPLTSRVMVNRIWKHHFGKGLVRTPSNFGSLGERPTHPELLDYLATRFVESGWSIKSLQREIVLSATYQQGGSLNASNMERDSDNRYLWRMNRRRLEVEAWRDAMLAVANQLEPTIGGPSAELTASNNRRRTLYGSVSRHELNSLLRLFDFPDPNITSDDRTVTTVPLQQLFVLNSEFMVRNSKALASSLSNETDISNSERIRRAFLLLYGRPATEREVQLGLDFLSAPDTSAEGTLTRWQQYAQVLLSANEFLYVD